jgi:DNA-directed RNA polymerase subunit M/transcription elongation factor TFIIS
MMLPNVVSDEKLKKSRPGVSDTMDGDEGSDKKRTNNKKWGKCMNNKPIEWTSSTMRPDEMSTLSDSGFT